MWSKAWIFILKKAKEEPPLPLHWRVVKSVQIPGCISQGIWGRPKSSRRHVPGSVPCHARHAAVLPCLCHGCSTQAVGLAGFLPSCPWPLQGTVGPMGTSTLRAHRRASSARGAEQEWQQPGLLETDPKADLSLGLTGCRQPVQWCKAAAFQAGPAAAARPGQARGLQPWAGRSCPRVSDQSHCQGPHLVLSGMLSANYTAHSSPQRGDDSSWGQRECFRAADGDTNGCLPREHWGLAQGKSERRPHEGLCCMDTHTPSLRKSTCGALDQSPETLVPRWEVRAKLSEGKGGCHALGSPVWERRAVLPAQLGQILFPCCPCASSLSVPSYSITTSHGFAREIIFSFRAEDQAGHSLGWAWVPRSSDLVLLTVGQLSTMECGCEASSPLQSLRCTPGPFLSGPPNHYSTM